MSVFVYDNTGLIEERPEMDHKQVGKEVHAHNIANPANTRRIALAPAFPPPGCVFDATIGSIRHKTLSERAADGELSVPAGYTIVAGAQGEKLVDPAHKVNAAGEIVKKTMQELIDEGLVGFDSQTQKVVNEEIVPKTNQELLDDAVITLTEMKQKTVERLRREVEAYFAVTKTTNGYSMDMLARQKASFSYPYRGIADTDPGKADLLTKKLIYSDAVTDEILASVEQVQAAYTAAKSAAETALADSSPASVFEAIKLADYFV